MTAALLLSLSLAAADPSAWHLAVATEGGLHGRGEGGIELRSSGDCWVTPPIGPRCEVKVAPADLQRIDLLVKKTKARYWKPRYTRADNPKGCCDLLVTLLFLTTGAGDAERRYGTGWFEDARGVVPPDAATLHRELDRIRRANPCPRR